MSHASSATLKRRHQLVRDAAARYQLDALVVTTRSNILYLTNFTGSAAVVVLTPERVNFITDFRYLTALDTLQKSSQACPDLQLSVVDGTYDSTLIAVIGSLGAGRLGFEASNLTVSRHSLLAAAFAGDAGTRPELIPTDQLVERIRVRKDNDEIATLRDAAGLLSEVARGVFEEIALGRTERDIALAIDNRIRRAGFERPAFDTIVASGPRAALPHATPGERRLSENDLVVLDFGGVYDSYCVGPYPDGFGRPGRGEGPGSLRRGPRSARSCDSNGQARSVAVRRRCGGPGLADHVWPGRGVRPRNGTRPGPGYPRGPAHHPAERVPETKTRPTGLTPGMVFTIEPGAYLPGWGGVRIEDDVLVTEHGVDVLTSVTTDLLEL